MELWIRSQNKEVLAKVDVLYVEEGKKYSNIYDGYDIADDKRRYGRYKTRDKAIEVLSDINRYVEKATFHKEISDEVIFYEMPKE